MALFKYMRFIATLIIALASMGANAHLMVAQQGTINIVGTEAFVVISIPISAFVGIDTNQDGQVSMIEFNLNRNTVTRKIEQNFMLVDKDKSIQLIDILLSPVQSHHSTSNHFTQLTVMGKFKLENLADSFKLKANLFGINVEEQVLKITIIRDKDNFEKTIQFNPTSPTSDVLLTQSIKQVKK